MTNTDSIIRAIWTALGTVIDPEVGLDIVTMGLVYDVEVDGDSAVVVHTLTSPGCPMERIITDGIHRALGAVDGIVNVNTRVVWDPSWHPGMIAPGAFESDGYV
jgi:metal-sulfur cluster biosynthetic enzyme